MKKTLTRQMKEINGLLKHKNFVLIRFCTMGDWRGMAVLDSVHPGCSGRYVRTDGVVLDAETERVIR